MICTTSEEQRVSHGIEKQLRTERHKMMKGVKLLLLGTGESGKSTIAKQLKIMHLNGFKQEERDMFRGIIHSNLVEAMATLVRKAHEFNNPIEPDLQPTAKRYHDISELAPFLNKETASETLRLWKSPAIQQTYERRAEFQLPGSVDYLLDHVDRLLIPDAKVEDADILHTRMQTRGIVEIEFELDDMHFLIVDVGGQRSERRKWFQCFAAVTAVIFCVALNEYDEKLCEDHTVNRMTEAIELFKEVSNNKYFNDAKDPTSIILFLNKKDLFEKKIEKVPLKNLFPDYKGGANPQEGAKFILNKLTSQCKVPNKQIFSHVTCATDTENVRVVFNAVRTTVLTKVLAYQGF